jgi:hypothetical protein
LLRVVETRNVFDLDGCIDLYSTWITVRSLGLTLKLFGIRQGMRVVLWLAWKLSGYVCTCTLCVGVCTVIRSIHELRVFLVEARRICGDLLRRRSRWSWSWSFAPVDLSTWQFIHQDC